MFRILMRIIFSVVILSHVFPVFSSQDQILSAYSSWGGGCSAVSLFERENKTYIAAGMGTRFEIYDLNDTVTLVLKGVVEIGSFIKDIEINGSFACVAAGRKGLIFIDISNIEQPVCVSTYTYPYGISTLQLAVKNNRAYVIDSTNGLLLIDISNPASPKSVLGTRSLLSVNKLSSVAVGNDTVCVGGASAVNVFKCITPDSLVLSNKVAYCGGRSTSLAIAPGRFFSGGPGGINVISSIFPPDPCICSRINTPVQDCFVESQRLYVAALDSGVYIMDISGANCLPIRGRYKEVWNDHILNGDGAFQLKKKGNLLFVAYGLRGLIVLDISDETAPVKRAELKGKKYIEHVAIDGTRAYIASVLCGFHIVSIETPKTPKQISSAGIPDLPSDISFENGYVYIGSTIDGLHILDVHDNLNPITSYSARSSGVSAQMASMSIAASGNLLYLGKEHTINTFDISDKSKPVSINKGNHKGCNQFAVQDSFLIIAYEDPAEGGVYIYNRLSVPNNSPLVSYYEMASCRGIAVQGNYAYVIDALYQIHVLDISNRSNPHQVSQSAVLKFPADEEKSIYPQMCVQFPYLFVNYCNSRIFPVNIINPAKPEVLNSFICPGSIVGGIQSQDSLLFVANDDAGLQILKINTATVSSRPFIQKKNSLLLNSSSLQQYYFLNGRKIRIQDRAASGYRIEYPLQNGKRSANRHIEF
jgi:hypothetical protein